MAGERHCCNAGSSPQHSMLRRNNYLNAMPGRKSMGAKVPKNEAARLTAGT